MTFFDGLNQRYHGEIITKTLRQLQAGTETEGTGRIYPNAFGKNPMAQACLNFSIIACFGLHLKETEHDVRWYQ